ncbi:MAG: tripartite tricarboxylate transporter permease [Xanthobacteraceae bacterium]
MLEAFVSAVGQILHPAVIGAMLLGLPLGLIIGLLPGLSGITAFAFLMPFTFGMSPLIGLAFLLSAYAAVSQGGSMTAIVLGVPGEVPNAATVIDGYAMTKQGRAGEAIGAALMASALGGLFGCVLLAILLPILQPIILSFASPENFFLALAGIAFIAVLSAGAPIKGLIAGALGIFMSMFGYSPTDGVPRFWLGIDYMLDGLRLVPLAMGLFAVPEILALMSSGKTIARRGTTEPISFHQVIKGGLAVFKHLGLFLRSSALGSIIGIMPGVGGATAPFVAYAAGKQMSKDPESFGTGRIEGVIAPESSSNAKEGGALVPTLALGIPGSASMALMLGAFIVLGLQPGPEFLIKHMDLAFGLAMILAFGNVASSVLMFLLSKTLVYITRVPGNVLAPILLVLVTLGTYSAENNPIDVLFVFIFGILGVTMLRLGYNRPALLLGFVLGETIERYYQVSVHAYGPTFFMRPISIAIIVAALACLLWPSRKRVALMWRSA